MDAKKEWPSILGFSNGATITEGLVDKQFRLMAKKYHPDAGGTTDDMQQLNIAKQIALDWIKKERESAAVPVQPFHAVTEHFRSQQASYYNNLSNMAAQQQHANSGFYASCLSGLGQAPGSKNPNQTKVEWVRKFMRGEI